MKTLKEHNDEVRRQREQIERQGGRRTGLECDKCGTELIEIPKSQNSSYDETQWVSCSSCHKRFVMETI